MSGGILFCPSMMCAGFGCLENEMKALERAGADIFHIDIMDGAFVPNFGMGLQDTAYICQNASIPCDVHLMIMNPVAYVERFAAMGAQIIYIHPEADCNPLRTLQMIRGLGVKAGIAVNPGTSVAFIEPLLPFCDYVLVMTVNPGFAGQAFIEPVKDKIRALNKLREYYEFVMMIDGACSAEKIKELRNEGADGFVLGTSALFGKNRAYGALMGELRTFADGRHIFRERSG